MYNKILIKFLMFFLCLIAIASCKKEGPVEKAGSRIDEIADNVADGEAPLKEKGALEKAGESADDMLDGEN